MPINERQKPYQITQEEQNLRWKYANGGMTFEQFEVRYKQLMREGKIRRSGRVIKNDF